MHEYAVLGAIMGALMLGAMSPGPSFVVVARTAVGQSRRDGLAAALGMGVGGVTFCTLALFGLYSVLASVDWLYSGLRIVGGAYLVYIAVRIWRHARDPFNVDLDQTVESAGQPRGRTAFRMGLITQLSNPKTAVVYGSIFAALLPATTSIGLKLALPLTVFAIEAGWYAVVAVAFSSGRIRDRYLRAKKWVDRVSAGVIGALGLRLIGSAFHLDGPVSPH